MSDDPNQLRDKIIESRDRALEDIRGRRKEVQKRIDALNLRSTQGLSQSEEKELDRLDEAMGILNTMESELQLNVLVALNEAEATKALVARLDEVNTDLKNKLNSVKKIVEQVKKLSELFKMIDGLIQSLTRLATLIP
jgi:septal ring factor EnvC (AmiA/AmiB activator)